jgi:arylformamidase
MTFDIDPRRYKVIDLSYEVVPGENPDRPFAVQKALLQDATYRYDVLKTHTHVGSHVECPFHFYDKGKTITDYPLEAFYGRAVLLSVREQGDFPAITGRYLDEDLGRLVQAGDIVIARNDSRAVLSKEDVYRGGVESAPYFTAEAAEWLRDRGVKLLGLDFIQLGKDIPETRRFHDILMARDVVLVEILSNLKAISKKEFFFMGLPFKVRRMDSGWIRAIAIEERPASE